MVEAKQGRYVMINYVPNDFLQTTVSQDEGEERINMNILGHW